MKNSAPKNTPLPEHLQGVIPATHIPDLPTAKSVVAKTPQPANQSAEDLVLGALRDVMDPELHVSIVDLGLIYGVKVTKTGRCTVTMTLTTIGCPLFGVIQRDIENAVLEVAGIEDVKIKLTFDPPWTVAKMTPETRIILGVD